MISKILSYQCSSKNGKFLTEVEKNQYITELCQLIEKDSLIYLQIGLECGFDFSNDFSLNKIFSKSSKKLNLMFFFFQRGVAFFQK
jgi:hypothetical protein